MSVSGLLFKSARHGIFWAPGGVLVNFGEKSAYVQVQLEGGLVLNPQKSTGAFPGFLGF